MKLLTDTEISAAYEQVRTVDEGLVGPDRANYHALTADDFELLLYSIYGRSVSGSSWYTKARLMVKGADQGRDVWLIKDERPIGLIQCKRVKAGFTLPDTLREVIKFLLHVELDPSLMPDPTEFRFILALSSDPAGTTTDFFDAPKAWLTDNEVKISGWTNQLIQEYEEFSVLEVSEVIPAITNALLHLKYELLRPVDLDALLETIPDVRRRFFKVQLVVALEDAKSMIDAQFNAAGLIGKRAEKYTRADIEEDLIRGSQGLADWPQMIWGQHIERPELDDLLQRINQHPADSTLLVGGAGSGKSALLAELYCALKASGQTVLAIKADMLSAGVLDFTDLANDLGMSGDIDRELLSLAAEAPVVLIIDQLDAVSEVMDQSSQRMQVLLRLASELQNAKDQDGNSFPVHLVVSSRPFEAKFDARFKLLDAYEVVLSLPSFEHASTLLDELDIDPADVPDSLKETLRTPFALNIYVDLIQSGLNPADLTAINLLERWLDKKLPVDAVKKAACMTFLRQLAADMTEHESLWRPAAYYEPDCNEMLRWAESIGLVIREGPSIGFSHQSWLDDFQAKTLRTAEELAEYAWSRQEGLFARGTVLRSLEHIRRVDVTCYEAAIRLLLPDAKTRRHLCHLVADCLASTDDPHKSDIVWVDWMARNDYPLANRAFRQVAIKWSRWRSGLLLLLPFLMQDERHRWNATALLIREAAKDSEHVMDLVDRYWSEASYDGDVFRLLERSGMASDRAISHVRKIFGRTALADWGVSHYASTLHKNGNPHVALDLIAYWAEVQVCDRYNGLNVYGAEKIAAAAPLYCAEKLLPWFVRVVSREVGEGRPGLSYPQSMSTPYDWKYEIDGDNLMQLLRGVLEELVVSDPERVHILLAGVAEVEVEEIQSLVADTYAANPEMTCEHALDFLFADRRRLYLGDDMFEDENGVGHTISGWSSRNLIARIAPHISCDNVELLRDYIESWEPLKEHLNEKSDPSDRRMMFRWAEEWRLGLLGELPDQVMTPIRNRQVKEWRAEQPKLEMQCRGLRMGRLVGSPMDLEQMEKASDDAIINMLNVVNDQTRRFEHPNDWLRGGVNELSRVFAAFAKSFPDRTFSIFPHLQSGVHEKVVGAAIRELAVNNGVSAQAVKALVWNFHERGFSSRDFYHDAACAMEKIATRVKGLDDSDIELLRSWLQRDPDVLASETERHAELNRTNRERNEKPGQRPSAMLFTRGGGVQFVPQRNFTLLSAIAAGYLHRDGVDCDGWLSELELHVTYPEDPEIWSAVLMFSSFELRWADADRVAKLIEEIWCRFPAAFENAAVVQSLWKLHTLMSTSLQQEIVGFWLTHTDYKLRQVAGELSAASVIVDSASSGEMGCIVDKVLVGNDVFAKCGVLFSAAKGWNESDLKIRSRSHDYLITVASVATGFEAYALSTAVDHDERLPPDELTRALLISITKNSELLKESMGRMFVRSLQHLLLYPGFEVMVLEIAEAVTELALRLQENTIGRMYGSEFIGLVIALQRSKLEIKTRAMTIYEHLLDADIYGAEDAAESALRR